MNFEFVFSYIYSWDTHFNFIDAQLGVCSILQLLIDVHLPTLGPTYSEFGNNKKPVTMSK